MRFYTTKYKLRLKEFFNRKKKSIGHAKAIIALARKIATIIWHLITVRQEVMS
ncbi:Mobile element protein [Methanosarcina siciliae C2J]|uniref:Mobile element protein n=1 Tax=Methanosarcina siciliae C2J TaxID=1434118 RepID=A0A0E3PP58_9EURY|nr:Mobile element protein [Methanosarcina siciliae C2J]